MYSFRVILALLHPLVPFVSERLWRAVPHTGPTLITGPWPSHEGAIDSFALTGFQVGGTQLALETQMKTTVNLV